MGTRNRARPSLAHQWYRCRSTTTTPSLPSTSTFPHIRIHKNGRTDHSFLRSALAYDWSKGHSGAAPQGQTNTSKIMLHPVKPEEVQKKKK